MSGRGKRKDEEDHASDGDSGGQAPPKKLPKKDSDNSDDIVVCEISKNRRVTVRNWNHRIWVDIREYYTKDGKQLPGKKGIAMSIDQWKVLRDHVDKIDDVLKEDS